MRDESTCMFDGTFVEPEITDLTGIIAFGGSLTVSSLLAAYKSGIFPWYNEGEEILWHHPDPRFVLFPERLKVSKSMKQFLRNTSLHFSINKDFEGVIHHCRTTLRKKQENHASWIHDEVEKAYTDLHKAGFAMSAEAWRDDQLVGGLYGVKIGRVFFGESMFAKESNASKFAFIKLIEDLKKQDLCLIDCQTHTRHLESLGAEFISRASFMDILRKAL